MAWVLFAAAAGSAAATDHPCARIDDATQRLACFDRHHPAAPRPAAPNAPPAAPTASAAESVSPPQPVVAPGSTARFGLPPEPAELAQVLESIRAAVREIGTLRHGERVFVLDNGQRWAERVAESRGPLKPGDRVTIERASFGSFLLVTPAGVGLRVRRLP